jgi:hypothetical protein
MLKRFYRTDFANFDTPLALTSSTDLVDCSDRYSTAGVVYGESAGQLSPYLEENLNIEEVNHPDGRWSLVLGNESWVSDNFEELEKILLAWARDEKYDVPADGYGPFDLEKALHEEARAFMAKHSKPHWEKVSLDEWLARYREKLSDDIRRTGLELLDKFDEL